MVELFSFIGDVDEKPSKSAVKTRCFNRQLTAKSKLEAMKTQGYTLEVTSQGIVAQRPQGRAVNAFQVNSLVKECFGDKCELVQPTKEPLWVVSELGNGRFLIKFNKEIF